MNIKYYIYIFWILAFFLCNQSVFSASWNIVEPTTIREMQESIDELEQKKNLLEFKWKNFKIWNSSLWELLKNNLTNIEKSNLLILVEEYDSQNSSWESILKMIIESKWNDIPQRKVLLLLKKEFYSSLQPFVADGKLEELMDYIGTDLSLNQKSKDVNSEISKIQSSKDERVQILQEKIEDNNRVIRKNIEDKITTEVKTKLDVFTSQWNFSQLSNSAKTDVFERVIKKLEYESIRLTNLQNTTSIIEEKIIVFRVVINLLKQYTESWSQ